MEIILLEKIRNLGSFGSIAKVANGYARNYLIPQGKAVSATKENKAKFEVKRAQLEKVANEKLQQAQERAAEISAVHIILAARAGDEGHLYGSIGTLEISKAFEEKGVEVKRQEIKLPSGPIRELGEYEIGLQLHAEVVATVHLKVVPEE